MRTRGTEPARGTLVIRHAVDLQGHVTAMDIFVGSVDAARLRPAEGRAASALMLSEEEFDLTTTMMAMLVTLQAFVGQKEKQPGAIVLRKLHGSGAVAIGPVHF